MSEAYSPARAGKWFLHSGIQEPSGGVARFYRAELQQNRAVSTEITGYTASALMVLFDITADEEYLDRARLTAGFLVDHAWNPALRTFPYEYPSPSPVSPHLSYFFDCGIIIRGLIAVWQVTKEDRLLDHAAKAAHCMLRDFRAADGYHPVLQLPEKTPLDRTSQWSRSTGCYQAKSALAWWEAGVFTGDKTLQDAYLECISQALATCETFLPGTDDRSKVMDRLHANSYLLEALSPLLYRADVAEAYRSTLARVSFHLREIRSGFERSDVNAQLLRARVYGARLGRVNLAEAAEEAARLMSFQAHDPDPRIDGGFYFGRRGGQVEPHVNPVSTAFAIQALEVWRAYQAGEQNPCHLPPV
ncbi:MAG: hypothetical protein JWN34_2401 [Bryobacterales bacterium]|nr:hypothetical protein [Bryobacterales bacterium]